MTLALEGRTDPREAPFRAFFEILVDGKAYVQLAYLLAAFPLGLAYFLVITIGLSLGTGLSVLLVGVPILLATLAFAGGVTWFEGRLTDLATRAEVPDVDGPGIGSLLSTHAGVGLVVVFSKFLFGIAALVLLSGFLGFGLALLTAPLGALGFTGLTVQWGSISFTSLPAALLASFVGIPVTVAAFHCCSLFVEAYGRGVARLYDEAGIATDDENGGPERRPPSTPTEDSAYRDGTEPERSARPSETAVQSPAAAANGSVQSTNRSSEPAEDPPNDPTGRTDEDNAIKENSSGTAAKGSEEPGHDHTAEDGDRVQDGRRPP